ncbi:MAG: tetratricopeptide repeat-containing sulfotransferase family protein [Planctomycetota bacterium]|jgi:tetratricopeptide (TPR) repeat protein
MTSPHPPPPALAQAVKFVQAGRLDEAERIGRRILKRNKKDRGAMKLLGFIAHERGEYDEAVRQFKKCSDLVPGDAAVHLSLGKARAAQGRYQEAIASFDRALKIKPGDPESVGWKAGIFERAGDYTRAMDTLRPFVESGTEDADMAELQARLEIHTGAYEAAVAVAARHLDRPGLPRLQTAALWYVTGRAHEKLRHYDESFAAFRRANEISPAAAFDPQAYVRWVDSVIDAFSADQLHGIPRASGGSDRPVFIAGMPRSGTTLVEQIIDAHPDAHGAGEIEDLETMTRGLQAELGSIEPYPHCVEDLSGEVADRLARRYLARLGTLGRGASRVVNKSLDNYKHLGLIAVLFPGARVIHCQRHPLDTCLSCYMGGLRPARAPYVTDLGNLGLVYRQYERLMRHWTATLDLEVLEVSYEALVDDLEGVSRKLIDFCGLKWDERCLRFYESGRTVLTWSYAQVTRPIYRSALARYKHFEGHLGPLREALAG